MTPTAADIRVASHSDHTAITRALVTAYRALPVCHWLVPDIRHRDQILGAYLALHVTRVLRHGEVHIIDTATSRSGALHAVAGWLPPGSPATAPGYAAQVAAATGRWAERFTALESALAATRPRPADHHRLAFMAVAPRAHHHGAGSLLLTHHLADLDRLSQPAWLETTPRSTNLYARHGFQPSDRPVTTAPRPEQVVIPMRRPATGPGNEKALAVGTPGFSPGPAGADI